MVGREGEEGAAVERLTSDIQPGTSRLVLERCLRGELPAADALRELIALNGDCDRVRGVIDQITARTAKGSRTGDRLIQDRVDELTRLIVDPEASSRA